MSTGCLKGLSIMERDCKSSAWPSLKADPTVCTKSTENRSTSRVTERTTFPTEAQREIAAVTKAGKGGGGDRKKRAGNTGV